MNQKLHRRPVAIAAALLASGFIQSFPAHAQPRDAGSAAQDAQAAAVQEPDLATVVFKTKRATRVSKGATYLPLVI